MEQQHAAVAKELEPAGGGGREVAAVSDEFGVTVIGEAAEVEAYLDQFAVDTTGMRMSVPPATLAQAFAESGLLARLGEHAVARFMPNHAVAPVSADAGVKAGSGQLAELRLVSRDPMTKRFTSNTLVSPTALDLRPEAIALIAIKTALRSMEQQLSEIQQDIAAAREDIQDLLALANAQRLGDVYGSYRVLARHVAALDKGQTLTTTDWNSLSSLGPAMEVGVERLHAYLSESTRGLHASEDVAARADKMAALVNRGEFVRTLNLLLVAQQSEYLWQRLRIERVRTAEPDALHQTLANTRELLAEHLARDRTLAQQLRDILEDYAVLRVTEVHHFSSGRKLTRSRRTLADGVDRFVELRTRQAANWDDLRDATVRDALSAVASRAGELANGARRGIASGASTVSKWIDPDEASASPDAKRSGPDNDAIATGDSGDPSPRPSAPE